MNTDARAAHVAAIRAREQIALEHAVADLRGADLEIVVEPRLGEPATSLEATQPRAWPARARLHAMARPRRVLHGSVSTQLTRSTACPLIVVPPNSKLVRAASDQAATTAPAGAER